MGACGDVGAETVRERSRAPVGRATRVKLGRGYDHLHNPGAPAPGAVRAPAADRHGRYGGGVPRATCRSARIPEARRRQAHPAAVRARPRLRRHVRRRGARVRPPRPPQHRAGVRLRRAGGRALHGHGVRRRHDGRPPRSRRGGAGRRATRSTSACTSRSPSCGPSTMRTTRATTRASRWPWCTGTSRPATCSSTALGAVKLTDFGIARAAEIERRTDAGQLKGKLGYMSPEQVVGRELDARSDIFTLGIVLAEMLILRPALQRGQGARRPPAHPRRRSQRHRSRRRVACPTTCGPSSSAPSRATPRCAGPRPPRSPRRSRTSCAAAACRSVPRAWPRWSRSSGWSPVPMATTRRTWA